MAKGNIPGVPDAFERAADWVADKIPLPIVIRFLIGTALWLIDLTVGLAAITTIPLSWLPVVGPIIGTVVGSLLAFMDFAGMLVAILLWGRYGFVQALEVFAHIGGHGGHLIGTLLPIEIFAGIFYAIDRSKRKEKLTESVEFFATQVAKAQADGKSSSAAAGKAADKIVSSLPRDMRKLAEGFFDSLVEVVEDNSASDGIFQIIVQASETLLKEIPEDPTLSERGKQALWGSMITVVLVVLAVIFTPLRWSHITNLMPLWCIVGIGIALWWVPCVRPHMQRLGDRIAHTLFPWVRRAAITDNDYDADTDDDLGL
tara:strand:- start:295 stop:1239 length:945 start_codon:yes stop_codon:yes gene_type:complete